MINAIIMASGFSSRMGENKLLMKYNSKPIIENVLDVVKRCNFKEVIVVSKYKKVLDIANDHKFKSILNESAELGQSESIKLGILNSSECEGFMFFVGDQPLICKDDVNKLIMDFSNNKDYIVIPTYKGRNGNPVIFPKILKEDLLSLKADEKGKKVIKDYDKIKYVEVNKETLMDIDTKEDYEKLIKTYSV